jgi:Zn-dependent protease
MGMEKFAEPLLRLGVLLPLLLLAVSVKEAGHAVMARWRGDATAADLGRASLLPFSHFDWIGCLALPALLAWLPLPYVVGYGRPVPVDPTNLKSAKADFSLVALAGPLANVAMALALAALAALLFLGLRLQNAEAGLVLGTAIVLNALVASLGLLPLPGFNGLKVLYAFLPDEWCWRAQKGDRYFLSVLVLLAAFGALDVALLPGFWLGHGLCRLAGLPVPAL